MNTNFKIGGAILLLTLAIACNKKAEENGYAMDKVATVDSSSVADDMSSSAAVEDKNSKRKFIRTANARFARKTCRGLSPLISNSITTILFRLRSWE